MPLLTGPRGSRKRQPRLEILQLSKPVARYRLRGKRLPIDFLRDVKMNLRCLTALLVLLTTLASTQLLSAANRMSRQEIKSMPLMERPNRPGHIYGNTVRRSSGVNNGPA